MADDIIYKKILRDYEKDRDNARRLLEKRKNEVYLKVPRIQDIDKELAVTGLKISKTILNKGCDKIKAIKELEENNQLLIEEKESLLISNGYDKNYFKFYFKCNVCQDTGYVDNKKCNCFKQRLIDKAYDMSNLKDIIIKENFDYFNVEYYSDKINEKEGMSPRENAQINLTICLNFANNFDNEFNNLLLYGDSGLGKTFLCNCIAKELLNQGKTVIYTTAFQLFKMIDNERFNKEENYVPSEMLKMIEYVDLLIIDDLGTEFLTLNSNTELFNFINSRLIEKKSTIISTNLSLDEIMNHYSYRIVSRFLGNYKILQFFGEDIRILKKKKG